MRKHVVKLDTRTKRIKFSWKNLRQWLYCVHKSNPHYSSEGYYSYYVRRHFLGRLTFKKVIVYFDEKP